MMQSGLNVSQKRAGASLEEESVPSRTKRKKKDDNENFIDVDALPDSEQKGFKVDDRFYPPEISNTRCKLYDEDVLVRPIDMVQTAQRRAQEIQTVIDAKGAVVHWFKSDLRLNDNHALSLASKAAQENKLPLICLYIISPEDFEAHSTSPSRVDFILRTLNILKQDLANIDIPLYVETVEKRVRVPSRIIELCRSWGANMLFTNLEYEIDELRREARLANRCMDSGIYFDAVHDTCVVPPGSLIAKTGKQRSIYRLWSIQWVDFLYNHPECMESYELPVKNPLETRKNYSKLFASTVPSAPANKLLTEDEKTRFAALYPAGEHEAQERLHKFVEEKLKDYENLRDHPSARNTSMLSVHFTTGTLSARMAISTARGPNKFKKFIMGNDGISMWIRELGWRDYYKHILCYWPYICMSKPFKLNMTQIPWVNNNAQFRAWKEGMTGYPLVDAAMRCLRHTGYMHNRLRMVTASFLSRNLLIDWRLGERYFMLNLIDGDFASNNGGWGFAAGVGVANVPHSHMLNPIRQSVRFDKDGEFIKEWVPELRSIEGSKAIHDPYGRGEAHRAEQAGYPRMIVEYQYSRKRALDIFKAIVGKNRKEKEEAEDAA